MRKSSPTSTLLETKPDLSLPQKFQAQHRRKLRVLHIGNVANYAYVNAKLMRELGVECDVVDPDFYHIMACPEWHEARVEGLHGDDFLPKWSHVTLDGFKRPDWFVQGPSALAFSVLALRGRGQATLARLAARRMKFEAKVLAGDFTGLERDFWTTKNWAVRCVRGPLRAGHRALDRYLQKAAIGDKEALLVEDGRDFLQSYRLMSGLVSAALESYDVVIGYTVSGVFAATAGFVRLCNYELGTLRGLPYEDSDLGRLTRWLYTTSPEVFVTNVDCLDKAYDIGIEAQRINPTLHAYDIEIMRNGTALTPQNMPADRPFFFAPARHHWKEGNSSWLKGNDVYIRALGKLAKLGYDFEVVTVDWGNEVALSRELIEECGLSDRVKWIPPQSRPKMRDWFKASVAVIDQFNAAAFGGAALDAMACGRRLLTKYDERAGTDFFNSSPPVDNCPDETTLVTVLKGVLDDLEDKTGKGLKLQAWLETQHGVAKQMGGQFRVFARLLEKHPIGPVKRVDQVTSA